MRGKFSLTEIDQAWNRLAREMEEDVVVTYNVHETIWHKCSGRERDNFESGKSRQPGFCRTQLASAQHFHMVGGAWLRVTRVDQALRQEDRSIQMNAIARTTCKLVY